MKFRTKTLISYVLFSFLYYCMYCAMDEGMVYDHEMAHARIAEYNGCNDWLINVSDRNTPYFVCFNYTNVLRTHDTEEYLLDGFNEVVNYNVFGLFQSMWVIGYFMMSSWFLIIWMVAKE